MQKPKSYFEQHLLNLVDELRYACPYCFKFFDDKYILKHMKTHCHRRKSSKKQSNFNLRNQLHYVLPDWNGFTAFSFGQCFIKDCQSDFFNSELQTSYADQLRNHLLLHSEKELRKYHFSKPLLDADKKNLEERQSKDFVEIPGVCADETLLHEIIECLDVSQKEDAYSIVDFLS